MVDGERVKHWRLARLWNQSDLAEHSGVSQDAISEIEKGKRQPRATTLAKLANALGIEPRELLRERENVQSSRDLLN